MTGIFVVLTLLVKMASFGFLPRGSIPLSWARVWGKMQTRPIMLARYLPENIKI